MEDDAIRTLVARLSRPHRSGGEVIERATILAEGTDSTAILAWIDAHDGQPEEIAAVAPSRGLHSARLANGGGGGGGDAVPRRYVLPPGTLS